MVVTLTRFFVKMQITFSRLKILGISKQIFFLNLFLQIYIVKQVTSKNDPSMGCLYDIYISGPYNASNLHIFLNICIVKMS